MKYEFMEHTADVKFRAYGNTLDEAFENAILAFTAVLVEPDSVAAAIRKKVSITSDRMESLLYDLFQELVFLMDTEGFITGRVNKLSIDGKSLNATLEGDLVSNYETSGDIKNATYTEMEIHDDEGKAWVQAVLDI